MSCCNIDFSGKFDSVLFSPYTNAREKLQLIQKNLTKLLSRFVKPNIEIGILRESNDTNKLK